MDAPLPLRVPPAATEQGSPTPWLMLRTARGLLAKGEPRQARRVLDSLLDEQPDFAPAFGWYGMSFVQARRYNKAIPWLRRSVTHGHATDEMISELAVGLARTRRYDELSDLMRTNGEMLSDTWLHPDGDTLLDRAFAEILESVGQVELPTADRPAVMFHLPFCAGTSFALQLRRLFGPRLLNVPRRTGQLVLSEWLSGDSRDPVEVVRLHHPYPLQLDIPDARWLTILRNPVSRFVSGFRKRDESKILPTSDFADGYDLDATIDHAERHGLDNWMARELCILHPRVRSVFRDWNALIDPQRVQFEDDLAYLHVTADLTEAQLEDLAEEVLAEQMAFVGTVEHHDVSYLRFMAELGMRAVPTPIRAGTSDRSSARATPQQQERILSLHSVDQRLWERWSARLLSDNASAISTVAEAKSTV